MAKLSYCPQALEYSDIELILSQHQLFQIQFKITFLLLLAMSEPPPLLFIMYFYRFYVFIY